MSFKNKTVFISGATRGIGHAIGMKLAAEGANIVEHWLSLDFCIFFIALMPKLAPKI